MSMHAEHEHLDAARHLVVVYGGGGEKRKKAI